MSFGIGPLPFLIIFGIGCIFSTLYYIIHKIINKHSNLFISRLFDCLFTLFCGAAFLLISYLTLEGEFRLFMILGLVLSFALVTFLKKLIHKKLIERKNK